MILYKITIPKTYSHQILQGQYRRKIIKGSKREGAHHLQGNPIRVTADLQAETLLSRGNWEPIFSILKEKKFQPGI